MGASGYDNLEDVMLDFPERKFLWEEIKPSFFLAWDKRDAGVIYIEWSKRWEQWLVRGYGKSEGPLCAKNPNNIPDEVKHLWVDEDE